MHGLGGNARGSTVAGMELRAGSPIALDLLLRPGCRIFAPYCLPPAATPLSIATTLLFVEAIVQ